MDKNEKANRITEILVQTQFAYWVDKTPQTAEESSTQRQRARDYYLGRTECPQQIINNKFTNLVKSQTAMILREVYE